jgi:carboxyl-terminal processing protease
MRNQSLRHAVYVIPLLLCGCLKSVDNPGAPQNYETTTNLEQVFQSFWNGVNNQYVFWDIDSTNWDSMYMKYQPMFATLDIHQAADNDSAYNWIKKMTAQFKDSHFNISFYSSFLSSMSSINPSAQRYATAFGHHTAIPDAFFFDSIPAYYLDQSSIYKMPSNTPSVTDNTQLRLVTGTIQGKILYFSWNAFYLYALDQTKDPARLVIDTFINRIATRTSAIKGIILDVRSNNGGELIDMDFLVGRLISSAMVFGYTRTKDGPGRLDYGPWEPATAQPLADFPINIPVIILADNHSVSMAEQTAMAVHTLPTGTIVGEHTWGANGPLTASINFDDGQFYIGINANAGNGSPSFSSYGFVYTSSAEFRYIDGVNYEGKGFPPDHPVPYNPQALAVHDDPQLDTAISLIH